MSNTCASCSAGDFMAERRDSVMTASQMLKDMNLPQKSDGEPLYTVEDVMTLACYLIGMGDQ